MYVVLDPVGKMGYFKWHWPENLHDDVVSTAEVVSQPLTLCDTMSDSTNQFEACYSELNEAAKFLSPLQPASKKSKAGGLKSLIWEVISDSEDDLPMNPTPTSTCNPSQPWRVEFMSYMETVEVALPTGMTSIQWWGVHTTVTYSENPH
jgi:hypothetical protein